MRDSLALTSSHGGSARDLIAESVSSSFKPTGKPAIKPESKKRDPTGEIAEAFSM